MDNIKASAVFHESEKAWEEFFKDKPEPKTDEEDRKQQEEFYQWYNYVRKQSDTGKTPAEMYKEVYGKEPQTEFPINVQEPSRMMNFEWDEENNEEDYSEDEEENLEEATNVADHMFDNGVWANSKEQVKDMSRKDSSKHMFRLGFYMSSQYMNEQMKDLSNKLKDMSPEEVEKLIKDYRKDEEHE